MPVLEGGVLAIDFLVEGVKKGMGESQAYVIVF